MINFAYRFSNIKNSTIHMVLKNLQTDFKGSNWKHEIDVRDFIQANYVPYQGDESFLTSATDRTK